MRNTPSPSATSMANVIVLKKEGGLTRNVPDEHALLVCSNNNNAFRQSKIKMNDASSIERNLNQLEKSMEYQHESAEAVHKKQMQRT